MVVARALATLAILAIPVASIAQPGGGAPLELGVQAGGRGIGPLVAIPVSPHTALQLEVGLLPVSAGTYAVRVRHVLKRAPAWYIAGGVTGRFEVPRRAHARGGSSVAARSGAIAPPKTVLATVGRSMVERPRWTLAAEAGVIAAMIGTAPTGSLALSINVGDAR
jgi:hypothetical protein